MTNFLYNYINEQKTKLHFTHVTRKFLLKEDLFNLSIAVALLQFYALSHLSQNGKKFGTY